MNGPLTWFAAARARLRLLFGGPAAESRMDEEFRFHVDMEAERLMREQGLNSDEAHRRARVSFGAAERYREELRDGRGLSWLSGLSLDLRLGMRMLRKYPGLAVVGGLGMAVSIAIAAVSFGLIYSALDPQLPLDEGDRVVLIHNLDAQRGGPSRGAHLHDLATWREQLTTVEDLGAFRTMSRNLMDDEDGAEHVFVAEMTASGFTLARVPPLLGRPLIESDEDPGAAPVIVIGEDVWQDRFAADPGIVGSTLRLGATSHTIVGVMPADFRFPVHHQYWVPLRLKARDYDRGMAPSVEVFGRLAPGADIGRARTEAATVGNRLQATYPIVYEHIRPQVMPYTYAFFDIDSPEMAAALHLVVVLISLLLVVVAVNVAVLNYARTATRTGEITVRTALGASRRRVVAQLFAEAFVLSATAAIIGLVIAANVLGRLNNMMQRDFGDELPFWFEPGVSTGMALYAAGLAVLGGVIVGVLPALRATGSHIQAGLRNLGSGSSGMQLGRMWTFMIVTQVAVAVAVLPAAVHNAVESARYGTGDPGFPADEYLQAWIQMERPPAPAGVDREAHARDLDARQAQALTDLLARLGSDPAVAAATFARVIDLSSQRRVRLEADGVQHISQLSLVDIAFLDAFDVQLLSGRRFAQDDVGSGSSGVIVNRSFARMIAPDGNALGRIIEYSTHSGIEGVDAERRYEIVGVVEDLTPGTDGQPEPRIYHAIAPGALPLVQLAVRVRGMETAAYARRLRAITAATHPGLQLDHPVVVADANRSEQSIMRMIAAGVIAVTLSVILLSAAGIYSMMSFTVARRRREIGIRAALGAEPGRLLRAIFARAAVQLGAGILIGTGLAAVLDLGLEGEYAALLPVVAALMLTVGLIAAAGPARRALSVQPTEALRHE